MAKFRKKPVLIDAEQFQWGIEDGVQRYNEYIPKDADTYPSDMRSVRYSGYLRRDDETLANRGFERSSWKPYIDTLEGRMLISETDFIITGIKGERYPCKADIFEATYEPAE